MMKITGKKIKLSYLSLFISSVESTACLSSGTCAGGFVCMAEKCVPDNSGHSFSSGGGKDLSIKNMFESGCLQAMIHQDKMNGNEERYPVESPIRHYLQDIYSADQLKSYKRKKRTCNSDDGVISQSNGKKDGSTLLLHDDKEKNGYDDNPPYCERSRFNYEEVRIAAGNWESSILVSWIYQIVLSEIFEVPTTIETGSAGENHMLSFYDSENRFFLPDQVYPVELLVEAHKRDGNCNSSNKSCAHIIPEVWGGLNQEMLDALRDGSLVTEESNGMVGSIGIYIPLFTAKRDATLLHYIGLQNKTREELATRFKTPTNWRDYCLLVSSDNCTNADNTSRRLPTTLEEEESFFVDDLYDGYFRIAESNNCTSNSACVGHIVAPPCTWTTYLESQMYWNNISLASGGTSNPNRGFTYSQMIEIWKAADATKSDVIFWWWTPEILLEKYLQSNSKFMRVTLPAVTEDCLKYRSETLSGNRCSEDQSERIGEEIGACDYSIVPLKKIMSAGIRTLAESVHYARRSPAFSFLKQVYIPEYAMPSILNRWTTAQSDLEDGKDHSREAVCTWVYENLDTLLRYSPAGYPRDIFMKDHSVLDILGYCLGIIALMYTLVISFFTYRWRKQRILKALQLHVLCSKLCGYALVAIAAIVSVTEPNSVSCTVSQWMIRFGYTIQFVPLLIKFSAINKLTRSSQRFRRINISPHRSKRLLSMIAFILFIYLTAWTLIDHPTRHEDLVVENGQGNTDIVAVYVGCAAQSYLWEIAATVWECLLLLATTVLAFQSRRSLDLVGERWLSALVYSHFSFLLMRCSIYILVFNDMITSALLSKIVSLLLSIDTILALTIYFIPNFVTIAKDELPRPSQSPRTICNSNPNSNSGDAKNSSVSSHDDLRASRRSSVRSSRHRRISGITIPKGGIPNLIKPKDSQPIASVQGITSLTTPSQKPLESDFQSKHLEIKTDEAMEHVKLSENVQENQTTMICEHDGDVQNVSIAILKKRVSFDKKLSSSAESATRIVNDEQLEMNN